MLEVGAEAVIPPVLAWSALHIGQERRADLSNERLGCVDQREPFLHLFVAQSVAATQTVNMLEGDIIRILNLSPTSKYKSWVISEFPTNNSSSDIN